MRTQCEGEQLYRNAAGTAGKIGLAFSLVGALTKGHPVPLAVALIFGGIARDAHSKADRLDAGCDAEKVAEALKNSQSNSSGNVDPTGVSAPGFSFGFCREAFIPSTVPVSGSEDEITINGGKYIWVCPPIVLDLDGDGLEYRSITTGPTTDVDNDGRYEQRAWVAPDDGVLVYDADGNGIGRPNEYVLTSFVHGSSTDLEALKAFDSDRNGVFNAGDSRFASFRVGRDLNQNGVFEANELQSLSTYGIAEIRLVAGIQTAATPANPYETAPGVTTFNTGQFLRSNGTIGSFADVAFRETFVTSTVYSDGLGTIGSSGSKHLWQQNSPAAITINLATYSYAGRSDFVDFVGNAGNDYVIGSPADNVLYGGVGADTLLGEAGDDVISGDYADIAWGNVQGGTGYDAFHYDATAGMHFDAAARSFEFVMGGSGGDTIFSSFNQYMSDGYSYVGYTFFGGDGNDALTGGYGNDVLSGGAGADSFSGGIGYDVYVADRYDLLTNFGEAIGSSSDLLVYDDINDLWLGNTYSLGIEQVLGGAGNDTIYASRADSDFWRQKYDNTFAGGQGNDFIYGGAGADTFIWNLGDGNDWYRDQDYGEAEGDIIALGAGVTPNMVRVVNSGSAGKRVVVDGMGGGTIQLEGFGLELSYNPPDLLVVDGKAYKLSSAFAAAALAGPNGIYLSTQYPAPPAGGTGGGGGGGGTGGGEPPPPCDHCQVPPIVIDLDGDGFDLIDYRRSDVFFDWDGDGIKERTGWVGKDDAMLVLDRNGDGDITAAHEIAFGVRFGEPGGFLSDLEGLREFDTNGNGSLDDEDAAFGEFAIWQDADSDAIVDPGELLSVANAGFEAISLMGYQTGEAGRNKENFILATTDAVFGDGRVVKAADAVFWYDGKESRGDKLKSASANQDLDLDVGPIVIALYLREESPLYQVEFV